MTQKSVTFLNEKTVEITKQAFKGHTSTYNVEISNSFNPELQLKDTESRIKSKLLELLSKLRGFRFVTTLVLEFKKIRSKYKTKHNNFYSSLKAEIIINEIEIENVL